MNKAFVLGAGLGERLRPLTAQLPKPMIPVFHRPLITYAFDHLMAAGVREFVVNTHHLPAAYGAAFPDSIYHGAPLHFRHEAPVRLETAGGIANIRDLTGSDPFFVYNGDILTDLPLQKLIDEHEERGNIVTLALRSAGPALHIGLDQATGKITDIRNRLGTGNEGTHLFTGIYIVSPEFHDWLTPGKVESVIPIFLSMIEKGERIGGIVLDEGQWWDLGNRTTYLAAHRMLKTQSDTFPAYATNVPPAAVHPDARIAPDATLQGVNVIGPGAEIGVGAVLEDCIIWPQAHVAPGAQLRRCIVRSGICAEGSAVDADL
ncbi:MAG: NTP transferase domain-containing protein [Verrucomicrobiales bacterium]|nr:NTP transferase domain-containing protein [Verrucomicrobiales bacterium]MCP5558882.1 NTP transferase domain-containing protein [Verrucomicrobiaceae bacterium]